MRNFQKTVNLRINVTMRRVPVTTVAVGKQQVLKIMSERLCSSLSHPAMRMGHIVICGLYGYTIFFPQNYLVSGTIIF